MQEIIDHLTSVLHPDFTEREKNARFSTNAWNALAEEKGLIPFLSHDKNGLGWSPKEYGNFLRNLGYSSIDNGFNFAVMANALACVWPLALYWENSTLWNDIAKGKIIFSNAITEEQGGSDAFQMRTTAEQKGDYFVIKGKKSFCSNLDYATHALVYAATDSSKGFFGGISAFVVDLTSSGVTKGTNFDKMGLRTASAGEITFSDVKVPISNLVGKPGSGALIFQESMVLEKLFMATAHLGTLDRWLKHMVAYSKERISGGQPIATYQSISHSIAELKISSEAAKAYTDKTIEQLNLNKLVQFIPAAASVKYLVSNLMVDASRIYMNVFAGKAYLRDTGIEVQVRDFQSSTIYSGTNEVQKNIVFNSIQ